MWFKVVCSPIDRQRVCFITVVKMLRTHSAQADFWREFSFIKGLYILKVLLNGEQTLLENIYGPNRDHKLVAFYLSLLLTIVKTSIPMKTLLWVEILIVC